MTGNTSLFIYCTGAISMISALPDAKQTCLDAGANDFTAKTFEMDVILQKVNQLITNAQKVSLPVK